MSYKSGLPFYTSSFHHSQMSDTAKFNPHINFWRWYCGLDLSNACLLIFLKSKFMRPPCCLYMSLCPHPLTFFKKLADFHKTWHEYDTSGGHPYPHWNFLRKLTVPKTRSCELEATLTTHKILRNPKIGKYVNIWGYLFHRWPSLRCHCC